MKSPKPSAPHQQHLNYLRRPFQREPDFGVTSVAYNFADLIRRASAPARYPPTD